LQQAVKAQQTRWYMMRAEQWIKTFPDKRLAEHSVDDMFHYLEMMGRSSSSSDNTSLGE
jgi:hypothetical protein